MIYLSGAVNDSVMGRVDVGVMLTPQMGNRPDLSRTPWAADTGCFANPAAFTIEEYLSWLDSLRRYHHTCLFATAPDVFGDGAATLAAALPALQSIGERVHVALVLQPGMQDETLPWERFDALFLGGPDAWQQSDAAWSLMAEGNRRGKWLHRGRVNSYGRLRSSALHGCDSADGTYLAFGPDTNWPNVQRWLRDLHAQPSLEGVA